MAAARTRGFVAGALALLAALSLGCGGDSGEDAPCTGSLRIALSGAAHGSFQLFVTPAGAQTWTVTCGPDAAGGGGLACAGAGAATLEGTPEEVRIVAKAVGSRTLETVARPAYTETGLGPCVREAEVPLALDPLGEPVLTPDYATGFSEDGLATFQSMAFASEGALGRSLVVKFYVRGIGSAPEVYFQNTPKHLFHYDFARSVLGMDVTRPQYETETYADPDRTATAGNVILYEDARPYSAMLGREVSLPITVEVFPSSTLTEELIVATHRLLEERLGFRGLDGSERRVFFVPPTAKHEADVDALADTLRSRGVLWLRPTDLYAGVTMQVMNPGIAYGTLRLMTPEQLEASVVSFQDILVLERLPNDLPIVGGTITGELQTPLAHVNVAAHARGTPNVALLGAPEDRRVAPHIGTLVRFEAKGAGFTLEPTTLEEAQAFWKSRIPEETQVPEADVERTGLPGLAEIGFEDSTAFGVKAANVAELAHLLGDGAPHGFAVPFHYYDRFMSTSVVSGASCAGAEGDCVEEGREQAVCAKARALCEQGAAASDTLYGYVDRLLDDDGLAADSVLREAALDALRWLINHGVVDPTFAAELDARVAAMHGDVRVRLRSSTNAEDLPGFSGAGLYTSLSANADKPPASERIRKVWASVWSWKAFEERSFWAIDHRAVRMAVLVHQAFPDELANGVLITQNLADPAVPGYYVNLQFGEVPVTNPEGGAIPEVFSIVPGPGGPAAIRQQLSSLSPDEPILSDAEVVALFATAQKVVLHFAPLYGKFPSELALDLELKVLPPDRRLLVKQARPYAMH